MIRGTTPTGTHSEDQAATWVRGMFGRIAPRYDLLNHLLSCNIDRYWRARTVKRVEHVLRRPDARILDLCCGTGDLMLALEAKRGSRVMGSDFCHPMLVEARRKAGAKRRNCPLFEADGLTLPLPNHSIDLITIAFGFRNFVNYRRGLEEMFRVLRKDGVLAILEFSQPSNPLLGAGYRFYSKTVLPALGGLISGSKDAYTYLPDSVRKFPTAQELVQEMKDTGFCEVNYELLTGGIVALHVATV